jgi:hypothetical protein
MEYPLIGLIQHKAFHPKFSIYPENPEETQFPVYQVTINRKFK